MLQSVAHLEQLISYKLDEATMNILQVSTYFINCVQWNPVNTNTKGTRQSVCIMRVSTLSRLSEKCPGHMFMTTKRFVTATSGNQRNLVLTVSV